jgi:protein-disulfide isomerase
MRDRGFLNKPTSHNKKKFFLIGIFSTLVLVLGGYVATTAWYFVQIKQGKQIVLDNPSNFTKDGEANSVKSFDREFLEGGSYPYRGKKDGAEITIVEFVDYNCPNCRMVYKDIDKVAGIYGNRVKIIIRQFPPTAGAISGHEDSEYLSEIAWCSWKQGRFWLVHDYIFKNYDTLPHPFTEASLDTIVSATGLSSLALKNCLLDSQTKIEVNKDYFDGVAAGVRGTPTFFINGQKVEGAVPFEMWKKYLDNINP